MHETAHRSKSAASSCREREDQLRERAEKAEAELAKLRMDIDGIRGFYHHSHQDASYSGTCHRCLLDQLRS